MNAREAIRASMDTPHMIVGAYLEDLTDESITEEYTRGEMLEWYAQQPPSG